MHMQVIQQSLFDSQANVILVHKYCQNVRLFARFALPAGNLFTQENESRASSQLSVGQVFGKTYNRNLCKITFPSMLRRCLSETSISLKTPVVN